MNTCRNTNGSTARPAVSDAEVVELIQEALAFSQRDNMLPIDRHRMFRIAVALEHMLDLRKSAIPLEGTVI